ncbi:MAG TPA: SRPBCC family protein, partial [Vicinamibacteria bacterium]|nr:SRPBCC family protein [Vicinamibacteria bacterium]
MKALERGIAIGAPPSAVWRVLTEFHLYPAWNPFVVSVVGALAARGRLAVRVQPWEGRLWRFRPRIVHLEEERVLCWRGRLLLPGLF